MIFLIDAIMRSCFFQAEDGIRDQPRSRGLGDVYKRQPRWVGDTNFMPVVGNTKVVVEGLVETWNNLKPQFDTILGNANA